MHSIRRILAAAALIVGLSPAAHALDLFTAASHTTDGSMLVCLIVNVGTKPSEVSATLQAYLDGSDITTGESCLPGPLAAGHGCSAHGSPSGIQSGYCHFTTTSSKVRAALLVYNSNGDVTSALPATK